MRKGAAGSSDDPKFRNRCFQHLCGCRLFQKTTIGSRRWSFLYFVVVDGLIIAQSYPQINSQSGQFIRISIISHKIQ